MQLFVRRYAPFSEFGGGFEGDTRTEATTSSTATARTVGVATFNAEGVSAYRSFSDGSKFLGAGSWLASKIGKKTAAVKSEVSNVYKGLNGISFTILTAGSNPLVPGAPDIDTYVDFSATFNSTGIHYQGTVRGDNFPNAEVFVVEDGGREVLLFDFRTGGDRTTGPGRLVGDHVDLVLGTFSVIVPKSGPPASVKPVKGT